MINVIVTCVLENQRLVFTFQFEEGEPKSASAKMVENQFYVEVPKDVTMDDIHPDHLALCAFLVARPWLVKTITFPRPVSEQFAAAFEDFRLKVGPIKEEVTPYASNQGGYIGLAFSGGVDSTAALAVLPSTTVPVFLDRPSVQKSLYEKEAAIESCNNLKKIGYRCLIVSCDLEMIRHPVGFPTDLANGVPAIVLAQHLQLFGISYGTVFESLYGIGRMKYKDYEETSHKRMWWNVFEAAGLPLSFPVAGISEVGTELICSKADIGSLARSCIRGTINRPCYKCWKCFRKSTLRMSLGLESENAELVNQLITHKEVKTKLSKLPISHEDVLLYAFSRLDLTHYPYEFKARFGHDFELSFLERWYSPSARYIDSRIRGDVISNIKNYLEPMDSLDETRVLNWNNEPRIKHLSPLEYDLNYGGS